MTVASVCIYAAQTLTPTKLNGPLPRQYAKDIAKTEATPPERLKKNVGLRNVPLIIEPSITLRKVTVSASRKPKNIKATRVIILASPSLIHGEGRGMSTSNRCRTTPRAIIREREAILRLILFFSIKVVPH